MARKKAPPNSNIAAQNRKARHDFMITETFETGIVLTGTEVKSLRMGRASITESFATGTDGELFLVNAHIPEYAAAGRETHQPRRQRKLLMHKRQIRRLLEAVNRQGMTLVPLSIYFNDRGLAKVELALAKGKQKADKRASAKDHDWKRQKARLMRDKS